MGQGYFHMLALILRSVYVYVQFVNVTNYKNIHPSELQVEHQIILEMHIFSIDLRPLKPLTLLYFTIYATFSTIIKQKYHCITSCAHATQEERGWQLGCLCLEEAHTHRLVSPLLVPSSDPCEEMWQDVSTTGPERSSARRTTLLITLLESLSRKVTLQTLSAMLLPHPHRKQQTQAAMMRNRRRRKDCWW